jgi:TonB dependent receptor
MGGRGETGGVGTYHCYSSAYQDFGATTYQIATMDYAGFVQDNWKVNPRLSLELGLRYDFQSMPAPTTTLTSAVGSFVPYAGLMNAPSDKNNFGPRVGFSLDVFGKGNTVLRGGIGMYYGRIVNNTIASAQFGSGSPNGQYQSAAVKPTAAGAPSFPYPLAGGSTSKPSSYFLAPNLQNPMAYEQDLQVQQQVGKGTVVQVSYLGSEGRELPNFLDVNLAPPEDLEYVSIVGGPGNGQASVPVPTFGTCTAGANCPYPTGYINSNFTNITEVISNVNSSYNALVAEVLNRSLHGLQFDANYTWSHALDFNQNATAGTSTNGWLNPYANARANYGVSQFNVGNRLVGYVLYDLPSIGSGGPLKYVANGWTINDSFQMQNGLPYSATIGTGYNSAAALNSSWNGVPSVYYIPTIGINTFQVPRAIVDDVRLQKAFFFHDRYNLQLAADMYNVANHENLSTPDINTSAYNFGSTTVATGAPAVGSAANPAVLTYIPKTAPNVGFGSHTAANNSGFLYTPREIEITAKLVF